MIARLAPLVALAVSVSQVPNPRSSGAWVSDLAHVVPADVKTRLDAQCVALEKELGVEVAIVTVPDVPGTPKEFATALFNQWGIGKAGKDNGLLILLVTGPHRLEMETGYGLEPILPDGWLGSMQTEAMVPAFKRGDYGGGLEAGLLRVAQQLRQHADEAREGARRTAADSAATRRSQLAVGTSGGEDSSRLPWIVFLLLAAATGTLGTVWAIRGRRCPKCGARLALLSEKAEDAHLSEAQQAEETIGSVDYRVYACPGCPFTRTITRHGRNWYRYSVCPGCHNRGAEADSTTVVAATEQHGGEIRLDTHCRLCSYTSTHTRHTPPLPRWDSSSVSWGSSGSSSFGSGSFFDSGSSSSGGGFFDGGSFGGGSSGGGGAGSSW